MLKKIFLTQIFGQPGDTFVRRRPGEAFEPECIIPTIKFGDGGIMIQDCIAASGGGEMFLREGRMVAERYITYTITLLVTKQKNWTGFQQTKFSSLHGFPSQQICHSQKICGLFLRGSCQFTDLNVYKNSKQKCRMNAKKYQQMYVRFLWTTCVQY